MTGLCSTERSVECIIDALMPHAHCVRNRFTVVTCVANATDPVGASTCLSACVGNPFTCQTNASHVSSGRSASLLAVRINGARETCVKSTTCNYIERG